MTEELLKAWRIRINNQMEKLEKTSLTKDMFEWLQFMVKSGAVEQIAELQQKQSERIEKINKELSELKELLDLHKVQDNVSWKSLREWNGNIEKVLWELIETQWKFANGFLGVTEHDDASYYDALRILQKKLGGENTVRMGKKDGDLPLSVKPIDITASKPPSIASSASHTVDYPCEKSKDGRHHFLQDGGHIYCRHCNKTDREIKEKEPTDYPTMTGIEVWCPKCNTKTIHTWKYETKVLVEKEDLEWFFDSLVECVFSMDLVGDGKDLTFGSEEEQKYYRLKKKYLEEDNE